jgi:DNA-binding protein HU-beta
MNKSELITRMTERLDGDRAAAVAAVNGVLAEIEGGVARGERVSLTGFGTFERRERAARTGRNPRTGEPIQVGPSVVPVFRAGAGFRSVVGGGDAAVPPVEGEGSEESGTAVARRAVSTVRIDVGEPAGAQDEGTRAADTVKPRPKGKAKAEKSKDEKSKPGKGKAGKAKAAKKAAKADR